MPTTTAAIVIVTFIIQNTSNKLSTGIGIRIIYWNKFDHAAKILIAFIFCEKLRVHIVK